MSQVLVEVLPNIHVCNIYITLQKGSESCRDLLIKKSECSVQFQSGEKMCLKLPRGTCLVPDVVRSMNQEAEMVNIRVQLDEKTSLISTLASDLLSNSDISSSTPLSSTLSNTVLSAHCKYCKQQMFGNVVFQRVLPMPSVDWEQASEDWFCHIHTKDGQKLKPESLQPQDGACFYTELFFLVHKNLMESMEFVKPDDGCDINCTNCTLSLGTVVHHSLKLWTHNLVWTQGNGDIVHCADVSAIMLSLLQNIDKDNFGVNCRLVLQLQTLPRKYLYLVTMNTNLKLLVPEDFELFCPVNSQGEDCFEDPSEEESVAVKRARVSGGGEVQLKAVYGVKLLYVEKVGDDEETGAWVDSVHVHILPCSHTFFMEMKNLLEVTTNFLPENSRFVDNMKVGYLIRPR